MQQAIDILDKMIKSFDDAIDNLCEKWDWDVSTQQGIRYFLKQAKSRIQALWDGWIPVTERKPKQMQEIDYTDWKWVFLWYYTWFGSDITYWRERPLPPKQ